MVVRLALIAAGRRPYGVGRPTVLTPGDAAPTRLDAPKPRATLPPLPPRKNP